MTLCAGDWVEIRSKAEILATLDENGRLEGMPFMPEMFKWCGQRFQVYKRAHKSCDTLTGNYVNRLLPNSVHLDLRCDGSSHGSCQAACLIFWKQAWLKPIDQEASASPAAQAARPGVPSGCSEADIIEATQARTGLSDGKPKYVCQATEHPNYTQPLKWWDARQYVEDYTSGNYTLSWMLGRFAYFGFMYGTMAKRRTIGRPARWLYDRFQDFLSGGIPFPRKAGLLASGKDAPAANLGLQPGDQVRVRPYDEILKTVDTWGQNRGMAFDAEMVPYCGKVFRVRARVHNFIDEKTGYMRHMKTPAVILDGVYCASRYSENRLFCPRAIYSWWREIWLEKVTPAVAPVDPPNRQSERADKASRLIHAADGPERR
ncbi:hypothetical protein [Bradyrhizobium sp.]|uniref:hypothetical protein n=1 Tax=Bradyrhizobium sp. TaxID=376 RepID=UPI003C4756C9